mmetsp:Transcript_9667/g.7303  ORF Transcript_9667/g.7303 Transcript_9667/m.7303 type:complete len:156 (+) Transcript_9667:253-720(+)
MSLPNGENSIIIVGAANTHYAPDTKELHPDWKEAIKASKIVLLQREIPEFINILAAKEAKESGAMVVLDVGGRDEPLSHELLQNVDYFSPNETELERVLGKKCSSMEEVDSEVNTLLEKYPSMKVVLKQGEFGCSYYEKKDGVVQKISKPAFQFE